MTYQQESELLELTRENNALLKSILRFVRRDDTNDFLANIIANIIGNRIDGIGSTTTYPLNNNRYV